MWYSDAPDGDVESASTKTRAIILSTAASSLRTTTPILDTHKGDFDRELISALGQKRTSG